MRALQLALLLLLALALVASARPVVFHACDDAEAVARSKPRSAMCAALAHAAGAVDGAGAGAGAGAPLGGQLRCYQEYACTITVPNYSYGFVVFPTTNVTVSASALNGNCNFMLGPGPQSYWGACCGPTGGLPCLSDKVPTFSYNSTCGMYAGPMYLSMESNNYIESDPVSLLTSFWAGSAKVPCSENATAYCPQ